MSRDEGTEPGDRVAAAVRAAAEAQTRFHAFTSIVDLAHCGTPLPTTGPLAGVPITVKDVVDVAGLPAAAGSAAFGGRVAAHDATCVSRLRAAGAVVVAKTTTPEFGLSWTTACEVSEETANPHDPARTAGGSSGGAAVSVATGVVPFAVGTDDAGSVRLPASFCGTVGFVGTRGRVPLDGIHGHSLSFTRVGALARSVGDAALGEAVMAGLAAPAVAGRVPGDPRRRSAPAGVTRARWWLRPAGTPGIEDAMVAAVRAALDRAAPGVLDVHARLTAFTAADEAAFAVVNEVERWNLHGRDLVARVDETLLRPRTREIFARGAGRSADEYAAAHDRLTQGAAALLAELGTDLLVSPTVACLPPPLGGRLSDRPVGITAFTLLSSAYGLPAVTVPCGSYRGLPLGLQLMAAPGADDRLLAVAAAVHRALAGSAAA
jgi:aspartyl-tRNA(Asn)/glutamyl-tRNA(Gln) amidotransferase subunit A